MKSFANCLVLSILLSSCTSLKQYSSVQQPDFPIYSFTNIEVIDGGLDSFGFCKIVKITGIIEIIDTGWEVYGYTLDHKEFKVDEFEKDNYIKTKKEYWKEMLSKYEDQGNYDYIKGLIVDDDLAKNSKDEGYSVIEFRPLFKKANESKKTFMFKVNFSIGGPYGDNYYKVIAGKEKKYFYWFSQK